jgi:hypothetical protein
MYAPIFDPEVKKGMKRRFTCSAAVNITFTIFQLLALKLVATTAVVGNSVFAMVRLRRVQIWNPLIANGVPTTCTITPVSFDSTDNNLNDIIKPISDTSVVFQIPAYIDFIPKKDHPSGMWHSSRNIDDQLFTINCTQGAIIDMDLEYIENSSGTPLGFTRVIAAATAGTIYTCQFATGVVAIAVNSIA